MSLLSRSFGGGGGGSSSAAAVASPLPELLSLSVQLHDSVRCPGSALSGTLVVTRPTPRSLELLHGVDSDSARAALVYSQRHQRGSSSSLAPARSSAAASSSLLAQHSTPIAASSSSSTPLARGFSFDLKLQAVGRAVLDESKVSSESLRRFRPQPGGSRGTAAFRIWSTRVVAISVESTDGDDDSIGNGASFPRAYEFRVPLPESLPPSFRGAALSHLYFLQVVATLPASSASNSGKKLLDLKLPFRVRVGIGPGSGGVGGGVLETPAGLVSFLHHCLVSPAPSLTPLLAAHSSTSSPAANTTITATAAENGDATLSTPPLSINLPSPSTDPILFVTDVTHNAADATTASVAEQLLRTPTTAVATAHLVPSASPSVSLSTPTAPSPSRLASRRASTSFGDETGGISYDGGDSSAPLTFNISKSLASSSGEEVSAHVVRLTLDQRCLRPGDTLRGHLDFSRASIRCYRVAIALEQEERLNEDVARDAEVPFTTRRHVGTFHAYTTNSLSTHFLFCLPLEAVANFRTDLTSAMWTLRFMFVTDAAAGEDRTAANAAASHSSWSFLPAPSVARAEPLRWTLPLTVVPHDDDDALKQRAIKSALFSTQPIA